MIKIWGRISSINVRKVVLAAQWLGIDFERIDAGRQFGVVETAAYRARNPNGLVPLLDDGALALWESNVIVRYLCAKHAEGTLYPQDLPARFDAERWMDWQQTTLNPAGRAGFVQLIRTPPEQRKEELVTASIAAIEPLWQLLDRHLTTRSFMTGEQLTMADIPIVCEAHRWRNLPLARPAYANLDRWYQRIVSAPAARGVFDFALS